MIELKQNAFSCIIGIVKAVFGWIQQIAICSTVHLQRQRNWFAAFINLCP